MTNTSWLVDYTTPNRGSGRRIVYASSVLAAKLAIEKEGNTVLSVVASKTFK